MSTALQRRRRPARRAQRLGILLVLTLVIGTAGCAMPSDDGPEVIAVGEDFEELLEPAPETSTTTTVLENTRQVGLWFIQDDLLSREPRLIPVSLSTSLEAVLQELIVTGTRQENHRSAIPDGVVVVDTRVDEATSIATIVLADDSLFTNVEATDLTRAIAQIVFTANGLRGIERVRFEIDGEIRSIPIGAGSNTTDAVGRCEYERFAPDILTCPESTGSTGTTAP